MKKTTLNPRLILTLVLSLLLTSCSLAPKPFVEVISDWTSETQYYGSARLFQKVSQPAYVKETTVYQVDNEMELALLAKILFDQGVTQFFIQDADYSIGKTYAYLDALMIHAFRFSMGTKTYSQGDKVVKTLDYVKIELFNDHVSEVDSAINDFIASKITASESTVMTLKKIHDGLILMTQYDVAVSDLDLTKIVDHTPFEAYGLFVNHKAVCSGYAKSFTGIASKLGIPALSVSSMTMSHAWNLVYDGVHWLFVDTTWDDPIPDKPGRALENYFLIDLKTITTDSDKVKAHVFDENSDTTLNAQDYLDFAYYIFPTTQP
jgi:hypothetical protein